MSDELVDETNAETETEQGESETAQGNTGDQSPPVKKEKVIRSIKYIGDGGSISSFGARDHTEDEWRAEFGTWVKANKFIKTYPHLYAWEPPYTKPILDDQADEPQEEE